MAVGRRHQPRPDRRLAPRRPGDPVETAADLGLHQPGQPPAGAPLRAQGRRHGALAGPRPRRGAAGLIAAGRVRKGRSRGDLDRAEGAHRYQQAVLSAPDPRGPGDRHQERQRQGARGGLRDRARTGPGRSAAKTRRPRRRHRHPAGRGRRLRTFTAAVVFVVDSTISMGPYIERTKRRCGASTAPSRRPASADRSSSA